MTETPLFPFGYGLSYTTFSYDKPQLKKETVKAGETIYLTVPVTNTGKMDGDEVVQVYLKNEHDKDGPIKTLRAFKRIHIPAGKTVNVSFELTGKQLEWWNENTQSVDVSINQFDLLVGSSSKDEDLNKITIKLD